MMVSVDGPRFEKSIILFPGTGVRSGAYKVTVAVTELVPSATRDEALSVTLESSLAGVKAEAESVSVPGASVLGTLILGVHPKGRRDQTPKMEAIQNEVPFWSADRT